MKKFSKLYLPAICAILFSPHANSSFMDDGSHAVHLAMGKELPFVGMVFSMEDEGCIPYAHDPILQLALPNGSGNLFHIPGVRDDLRGRLVITAAHCVLDICNHDGDVAINDNIYFTTQTGQTIKIKKAFLHPQFDPILEHPDLAILLLEDAIPDIIPARLDLKTKPSEMAGNTALIAGFGVSHHINSSYCHHDQRCRASFTNILPQPNGKVTHTTTRTFTDEGKTTKFTRQRQYEHGSEIRSSPFQALPQGIVTLAFGGCSSSGDSGGPLVLNKSIVGVNIEGVKLPPKEQLNKKQDIDYLNEINNRLGTTYRYDGIVCETDEEFNQLRQEAEPPRVYYATDYISTAVSLSFYKDWIIDAIMIIGTSNKELCEAAAIAAEKRQNAAKMLEPTIESFRKHSPGHDVSGSFGSDGAIRITIHPRTPQANAPSAEEIAKRQLRAEAAEKRRDAANR